MFSENLRAMRKEKGYTQEELAIKLNVVRQTVSKWEKGLSVPDADLLAMISDVLETPVSRLLGEKINEAADKNEIAEQLAKISEQLAIKNRRSKKLWKTIGITILVIVALYIVLMVVSFFAFTTVWHTTTERIGSIELDEPADGEEGMN
ncbi:MAG: helix-turn-helix transcriptional regulator [Butyrivibrio sp.]|jgi:putative transcriptional regulator|nr:helix-turn-helix transcriptional regulator [Butyrivibrio sp.]